MKKNKSEGKFIVIDGIDGSGKATQTKLLLQRLKKEGYKTATIDFPQYYKNFFGKVVGRYLAGEFGMADQVSPYLASVLYALDRWESKGFILKKINEGRIVVCDRYVSANMIHQGGKIRQKDKREELVEWLGEMEFDVLKVPKPNLVIYLDVPYDIGQKLVDKKSKRRYVGGKKRDIHEMDNNHLKNAQLQARELVKRNKKWIRINCVNDGRLLSPEEISDLVWSEVEKRI
jgi:dTMP kinase